MKKILLLLAISTCIISAKSQIVEDWTLPLAITDSLSFNSSPEVAVFNMYNNPETFVFYVKKNSDTAAGHIWFRKISEPMGEEQQLIPATPGTDYRNPKYIYSEFIIFESNLYGNYDLFGVAVDENGLAGNIFRLINTPEDDCDFFASFDNYCCWEAGGNVYLDQVSSQADTLYFPSIDTIDTGNCASPVCRLNYVAWQKMENNESHIYYSKKTYPFTTWSEPDTVSTNGNCTNLFYSSTISWWEGSIIGWQANDKIYYQSAGGYSWPYSSPQIAGIDKYYEPAAYDLILLTADEIPTLYAFAGVTDSIRDIFIVDDFISGYQLNITNDSIYDKNPVLHTGREDGSYYEIICTWQSEVNGHDVIYSSGAWYIATGGIAEKNDLPVNVAPNPVKSGRNFGIAVPDDTKIHSIRIYSTDGKSISEQRFESGVSKVSIKTSEFMRGLNFIEIETNQDITRSKLIVL